MKRFVTLSAFAAISSALLIHGSAQACDGEGKQGPLTRLDTNGDGKVTQQEMLVARTAHFDAADTNKDGTVTEAERSELAAHRDAHGKGHGRKHDDDDDDDEAMTKADLATKVAQHFKRLDRNADGVLTGDELEHGGRGGPGGRHGHHGHKS